ncbi:Rho guanine nucleotide exchange factor 10 [Varanus komodoensis]|nr:Rho guanine nucleotide exchange factor 10 [Varanus komodoensis]
MPVVDMLKNTTKGHPDRLPLQMALTELETLAEKLNERKRDADQRCEIKQIAKAMNERYLNKGYKPVTVTPNAWALVEWLSLVLAQLLSSGNRYLIRTDDMLETVYNDKGEIVKTKERRLFMLNDVLMCATVNVRSSHESSGIVTGQRYLLKWSVPLGHVDVIEYGSSEGQDENCRFSSQHPSENIVANAKPRIDKLYMGPGQLYHDLQNLLHDLNVVGQISQLIGSLKGNYQVKRYLINMNLNQSVAHDWTSGLQKLILKKEDEIRAADRCRIQLQLPGKQDKSGRPTFFTAVFNTFTPAIKLSWIKNLQMAKLALAEENLQGWFCIDDDGNQIKREKHPLLVKHMPVMMAKQQEFKVECAAYNPEPYSCEETDPDSLSAEHGFLWIGSCTNQMGQIAIVSFQNSSPKVIECFNVESRILCMVYIQGEEKHNESNVSPESENTPAKHSSVPTICLGMEEGSISVYKSSQGSKKVRLQHFFTPEKSTVMSLAYKTNHLFAGLVNGNIAIYTKLEDGAWNSEPQKVVKLGVLPVRSLLVMEETIWAASGGQIFIISTETHTVEEEKIKDGVIGLIYPSRPFHSLGETSEKVLWIVDTNLTEDYPQRTLADEAECIRKDAPEAILDSSHEGLKGDYQQRITLIILVRCHFEAHQEEGMVISHMAVAGVGIWIAFTTGSTLRLFHTETLKHLQDVNVATLVLNMLSGQQRVSVTSLLVCHGLLLVGTNLGIIVALPVPRLQGIPKVTGRGMVSHHAHNGPVKFLVMASVTNKRSKSKSRHSLNRPHSGLKDEDQKNIVQNERPSSLSNPNESAIWLGGSVGSIAQRSDLSSSSGSLTSSTTEHKPEESAIYELLKEVSINQSRKRHSKEGKAISVLVISGGQGHRRVNKKSKQQRPDELVSSVMVWQIPLLKI